ncbi:MAG TPA: rod-binding protein [Armatimonadota bacterium]|jgi:Rod binding domain-containing protein
MLKPLTANSAPSQPTSAPRDKRAWEAAVQFEGLLVSELLRQMRGAPSDRGLLPAKSGEQVFWNRYCQAVGDELSNSTPLGVAQMLYQALENEYSGGADAHLSGEPPVAIAPDPSGD